MAVLRQASVHAAQLQVQRPGGLLPELPELGCRWSGITSQAVTSPARCDQVFRIVRATLTPGHKVIKAEVFTVIGRREDPPAVYAIEAVPGVNRESSGPTDPMGRSSRPPVVPDSAYAHFVYSQAEGIVALWPLALMTLATFRTLSTEITRTFTGAVPGQVALITGPLCFSTGFSLA